MTLEELVIAVERHRVQMATLMAGLASVIEHDTSRELVGLLEDSDRELDRLCHRLSQHLQARPTNRKAAAVGVKTAGTRIVEGRQGQFWLMHDRLFESMTGLADETLVRLAVEIGLDVQRFVADLAAHRYLDRIREDMSSGMRSGVNGTPTFFVGGVRHDGRATSSR